MKTNGNILYAMDTLVGSCRSREGAMDLAKFMTSKFPLDAKIMGRQINEFLVVENVAGKIQVHSAVEVNDLGREDFKKYVEEFTSLQTRKPAYNRFAHSPQRVAAK